MLDPKREYSATEILKERFFPWALHMATLKLLIGRDLENGNLLETRITGEGLGQRYYIKGKNINRFLKRYGPAMPMPRKLNDKRDNNSKR